MPIIIALIVLLLLIAITDTYIGGIVYFIIWIINGTKNYWYITKKSACVFGYLIDKINLYKQSKRKHQRLLVLTSDDK